MFFGNINLLSAYITVCFTLRNLNTSRQTFNPDGIHVLLCRSIYYLTMLAVPHLIQTKGSIVNVSSVNGIRSVSLSGSIWISARNSFIHRRLIIKNGELFDINDDINDDIKESFELNLLCTHFNIFFQFPNVLAYNMSKSALDQFTRCTALGLFRFYIFCTCFIIILQQYRGWLSECGWVGKG